MKSLDIRKKSALAVGVLGLAVFAFGTAIGPAGAQAKPGPMTAQQAIHDLKANYGIMIIPRDGVDLNTLVSGSVTANSDLAPNVAVARLADAMDARARTVFIVLPATADRPVTTLSDARGFNNADAIATLHLSGVPADEAIRAVAATDNAAIDLRSDVGSRLVDVDGSNISVAEAIAQIAAQTKTHWIQAYELTPPPTATMARAPQFHRGVTDVIAIGGEGPTGPVYFHPAPPPPAQPTPSTNDQGDQTSNNAPANQPAQAVPAVPVNPYPPYFVMQNGYAYDPFGNPYPQTYSGFSNGGYLPGSGLYLTPGFGGWGSPIVFGGGSSTTPF
jgi:hypothetical protein